MDRIFKLPFFSLDEKAFLAEHFDIDEKNQSSTTYTLLDFLNHTVIENNTIVSNVVIGALADDSAGIHCTTWYGRLRNNIVMGNYETLKGKITSVKVDSHCTYDNNLTDAEATITSVFKDFYGGDFTINPGSEAYNKGTHVSVIIPSLDLAGNTRVFSNQIDIGCYECQLLPGLSIIIK